MKSKNEHSQVTSTSKKGIINPKKAALFFKFMKTRGMSLVKTKKKEKLPVM